MNQITQDPMPADSLHGYYIEDLKEGMTAVYAKTVTETDIVLYAGISGDDNPVHLNEEFARDTMFKGRIAHGMLSVGFISAVIGTRLPGPGSIYMSQSMEFRAPVRIGDTVQARATIAEVIREKKRVVIDTVCTVGDTVVIQGQALIMVPSRG
jgi:3-hydroxybutyryl-CoA dehydratase